MTCEPRRVWISIGSNHSLKDRYVAAASAELSKVLGEYLQSEPYTTPALNGVDADYLNAVATGFFCGSAAALSELCKGIENSLGRTRCRREGTRIFDPDVAAIADLHIGLEIVGKVNNITAFGAFVDIGLKINGLVHISQLSEDFVSDPSSLVKVGQRVRVKVIDVDAQRGRVALSMRGVRQNDL